MSRTGCVQRLYTTWVSAGFTVFFVIGCWCAPGLYGWPQERKHDRVPSKCAADIDPNKPGGPQLTPMTGSVKVEDQAVTFVSDKDQKSWNVMNPEALKGHSGKHVALQAFVDEEKSNICA